MYDMIITALGALATTAYAQPDVSQEQLAQCVAYFTEGGVWQWVGGGITVAFFVVAAFTKKNLPDIIKQAGAWVMSRGNK